MGERETDRLAEKLAFIEQMANECVLDLIEESDVLALVEIAKAAREVHRTHQAWHKLGAAFARLDGAA